jgi:hypothetical protein
MCISWTNKEFDKLKQFMHDSEMATKSDGEYLKLLHETGFSSEVFYFRVKTSSSSSHSEVQFGMTVGPHLTRSSYIFRVGW